MKIFLQILSGLVSIILSILVLTGTISGVVLAIWVLSWWGLFLVALIVLGVIFLITDW